DPLYSCRALHGSGGVASTPVRGKEALLQHIELPDAARVVGVSLRIHRLPGRVCSPQRGRIQSPLRPALFRGKSGTAGRARHVGIEGPRLVEKGLLES